MMLAETLDVAPRAIFDYAVRAQTRGEHRLLVSAHAGFRPFTERGLDSLGDRSVDVALERERPSLLFAQVCEVLRGERVERPSVDRLVRLVGWARERAHERTFERVAAQLTDSIRGKLDGLLVTDGGQCRHAWLRSRLTSVGARALRVELDKHAFLMAELGVDRFDLAGLPPNRRAWLAQIGRHSQQALAREELERRGRRDTQVTVRRFIDLSGVVLEAHDSGVDVLRLIERRIGIERLREDRDRSRHRPAGRDRAHRSADRRRRQRGSQAAGRRDREPRAAPNRLSSSDGQRFVSRTRGPGVAALPQPLVDVIADRSELLPEFRPGRDATLPSCTRTEALGRLGSPRSPDLLVAGAAWMGLGAQER